MIGRHEALLILACRAAQHAGTVISDEQAQEVAAFWHFGLGRVALYRKIIEIG